jgi:hypothetical protein
MEPKPVERHPQPKYPTRRDVMLGAGGFLLIELAGRGDLDAADPAKPAAGRTIVAPIFKHGEGRGATGCVVINPPVFLSEEEAMQVIREELAKHGVKLGESMTLPDVKIAARIVRSVIEEEHGKRVHKERFEYAEDVAPKPLTLNGVDAAKRVGVRFVSKWDYFRLGGPNSSYTRKTPSGRMYAMSTAQSYDFHETAEYAAAELEQQGKAGLHVGFLYDPAVRRRDIETRENESNVERRVRARSKAEELLRLQSRDFAAWLKQQKVL